MTAATVSTDALRRHHRRVSAMYEDRRLSGDTLLVALAIAHLVDCDRSGHPDGGWSVSQVVQMLWPTPEHGHGPVWAERGKTLVMKVLTDDVPRYLPPTVSRSCTQLKADGVVCGAKPIRGGTLTDPVSGEQVTARACGRHEKAMSAALAANRAMLAGQDVPRPPANSGGLLAEHLPELGWPEFWARLDPHYQPCSPARPVRPKLRVLPGAADWAPVDGPVARPTLTVAGSR